MPWSARRGLARTSNTPGRTQELNFFVATASPWHGGHAGLRLRPGPQGQGRWWTAWCTTTCAGAQPCVRVFLLIDARHGLKASDLTVMDELDVAAVSYQVVLTKIDKIKPAQLAAVLPRTAAELSSTRPPSRCCSPPHRRPAAGIAELRAQIATLAAAHGAMPS